MEVIGGVVARVGFSNSREETESEERGAKKPSNYHTPQWQYPYSTPFTTHAYSHPKIALHSEENMCRRERTHSPGMRWRGSGLRGTGERREGGRV